MTMLTPRNFARALKLAGIAIALLSLLANPLRGKVFGVSPLQLAAIMLGLGVSAAGLVLDGRRVPAFAHTAALIWLVVTPFLAWTALQYLTIDLWYDEIYTLKFFVFTSLQETLTNLHSTNNHIFLNVINHFYLQLLGISDMMALLDRLVVLRLLMLAYSLMTCGYVYRIAHRYFSRFTALAALMVLVTTLPFYNFAVQVRGYGLSMMLLAMLVYHAWRFEESGGWENGLVTVVVAALLLYTLPSNVYTAASVGAFYLLFGLARRNRRALLLSGLLAAAAAAAFLLYLPVLGQLLHNPNSYIGMFNRSIIYPLLPQVLWAFISGRYGLLALVLVSLVLLMARQSQPPIFNTRQSGWQVLFLLALLLVPFLLAFGHGYIAFDRVFVLLAPVFALLLAVGLAPLYAQLPAFRYKEALCLTVMAVYCYGTFAFAVQERDAHIRADIEAGTVSQDLYYNYFQADYAPNAILKTYRREQWANNVPVLVYIYGDTQSVPVYMDKAGIPYDKIGDPRQMQGYGTARAHIVTAFPNRFLADTGRALPGVHCQRLNPALNFVNVFDCAW